MNTKSTVDQPVSMEYSEKIFPDSGNVAAARFLPKNETLEVEFKNGKRYRYFGFKPENWEELITAKSIGSFIATVVKAAHKYEQINDWSGGKSKGSTMLLEQAFESKRKACSGISKNLPVYR